MLDEAELSILANAVDPECGGVNKNRKVGSFSRGEWQG
jgi:hypothetical protein